MGSDICGLRPASIIIIIHRPHNVERIFPCLIVSPPRSWQLRTNGGASVVTDSSQSALKLRVCDAGDYTLSLSFIGNADDGDSSLDISTTSIMVTVNDQVVQSTSIQALQSMELATMEVDLQVASDFGGRMGRRTRDSALPHDRRDYHS